MFALCDKQEIASNVAARMEVEDELRDKEGQQLSRRYLRELAPPRHHRLPLDDPDANQPSSAGGDHG